MTSQPKAPGEYLVESIAVGDLVKPERSLFAYAVESITDLGGSIVLHLANGATLEQVWGHVVEVVADPSDILARPAPIKPYAPPSWDCRTPSGHHFTMSFSTIEQRDAIESHWLDRHDYCRICPDCDGCQHPDCDGCHCD